MLDGDDGSVSPDSPGNDCTIRVFQLFSAWIMHSCTPQNYIAALIIFKYYFSVIIHPGGSSNAT